MHGLQIVPVQQGKQEPGRPPFEPSHSARHSKSPRSGLVEPNGSLTLALPQPELGRAPQALTSPFTRPIQYKSGGGGRIRTYEG